MQYDDPERGEAVAERAREFLDEVVLPKERALAGGATASAGTIADLRE